MHITVVIPVYNRREIVKRTLDSLDGQTSHDFRVILVDNGSTDGSFEVLRRWAEATPLEAVVLSCPEPGATVARNCGLERVTTPWTLFFDSDDVMLPTHIERLNQAIDSNEGVNLIIFDVWRTNLQGYRRRISAPKGFEGANALYHNLIHGTLSTQRYIAQTELIRSVGGWNPTVRAWNDIELGNRIIASGRMMPLRLEGAPTVEIISTEQSITGTSYTANLDRYSHSLDVILEHTPYIEKSGSRRKKRHLSSPRQWVGIKRAVLAADCSREGSSRGFDMFKQTLRNAQAAWKPWVAFAYLWRRIGLRGAGMIVCRLTMPRTREQGGNLTKLGHW